MAFLNTDSHDAALVAMAAADNLYICSAQPTTYAEAATTYALGVKAAPVISAPAAGTPDGRQATIAAFTDGSVTADGTAGFWALVDSATSKLWAWAPITTPQAVVSGNPFSMAALTVRIPAAL